MMSSNIPSTSKGKTYEKKLGEGGKLGLKLGFLPLSQGYIISFP